MNLGLTEAWYADLVREVEREHGRTIDRLGRPWSQHFQRVAMRMIFRSPQTSRPQIEAALMHDAMMAGGRGADGLRAMGLSAEAVDLIALMTPPPHGNYFRALDAITPADNAIYLDYIRGLVGSGVRDVMYLKLADVSDTIDSLSESPQPHLKAQLAERYEPSRQILFAALDRT